jgi:uncharacterized membrane protein YdjX (TVP38/TMEM64 family)
MLFRIAGVEVTWKRLLLVLLVVVIAVVPGVLSRGLDVEALHERAADLNGGVVFAALALLPLAGFPATILHVVAGARFGWGLGALLIGASILFQLLASYALVRLAPGFFKRRLKPVREKIPRGAHASVTLFTMLLPGVPYFLQNYVLAVIGVPLRLFVTICLPIHWVRSLVSLTFGHLVSDLTPLRIAGFVAYNLVIILGCAWAFRRLRSRLRVPPPKAGDPMPPASARSAAR